MRDKYDESDKKVSLHLFKNRKKGNDKGGGGYNSLKCELLTYLPPASILTLSLNFVHLLF